MQFDSSVAGKNGCFFITKHILGVGGSTDAY